MGSPKEVADEFDAMVSGAGGVLDVDDATLLATGHQALNVILLRTKKGLDADHRRFTPYTEAYAQKREKLGRSTSTVDLAITGHMQQSATVTVHGGEAIIDFMNEREAIKAAAHNSGVDKNVYVRSHSRKTAVNIYTGQRVSTREAKLDGKRKNKKVGYRVEAVGGFQRHQFTPRREWFDIRHPQDMDIVEKAMGVAIEARANRDPRPK